jgi:hypothetical protein
MEKRKIVFIAVALWSVVIAWKGARADEVMEWNAVAASALSSEPSPVASSVMAAMHVAVHDAVNSIEPRDRPYGFTIPVSMRASKEAAAAAAAHGVLVAMVPARKAAFDAALAESLSKIPEGRAKRDGIGAGKAVAQAVITSEASSADVLAKKLE